MLMRGDLVIWVIKNLFTQNINYFFKNIKDTTYHRMCFSELAKLFFDEQTKQKRITFLK